MDELTETWGDETQPLEQSYPHTRELYVDRWDEHQGGVIIEGQDISAADLLAWSDDIGRRDALHPDFDRHSAFAATRVSRLPSNPTNGGEPTHTAVPVGAAWLRLFSHEDPGWGFVSTEIPEMAIALRPGAVGRGLSQRLLAGLLDYANRRGYPGVSLAVEDGNERAARAYLKAGFQKVGRSPFPHHEVMLYSFTEQCTIAGRADSSTDTESSSSAVAPELPPKR